MQPSTERPIAPRDRLLGETVLLAMTFIWGTTFAVVRDALHDVSPTLFVVGRATLATLLFAPLVWRRRAALTREAWIAGTWLGLCYAAGFVLQTVALTTSPASRVAFLTALLVVFVPLLQALIWRRVPSPRVVAGIAVAVLGTWFLTNPGRQVSLLGDVLGLACAFAFAGQVALLESYAPRHDAVVLSALTIGTSVVFCTLWLPFEPMHLTATPRVFGALVYTALFASMLACYAQTFGQARTSAVRAGIIYTIEPVIGALFAYWWLGETMTGEGLFGAALITAGLLVSLIHPPGVAKSPALAA